MEAASFGSLMLLTAIGALLGAVVLARVHLLPAMWFFVGGGGAAAAANPGRVCHDGPYGEEHASRRLSRG